MATTKPVNQYSMPQGGIKLWLRDTIGALIYEIGVIDDPANEAAGDTADVEYNNWKTKKSKDGDRQKLSFKLYELRPEVLSILNKGLSETLIYDGVTAVPTTEILEA